MDKVSGMQINYLRYTLQVQVTNTNLFKAIHLIKSQIWVFEVPSGKIVKLLYNI